MQYAELYCKTNFSFLWGASHAEELVRRAAELEYEALAVTDQNTLAGIVRAHTAAKDRGFPFVVGAEILLEDALPVLLWCPDRAAYGRLCRLLTVGRRQAEKGQCRLTFDELAEHSRGLLAGVIPRGHGDLTRELSRYRELFRDRVWLMAALHEGPDDRGRLAWLRSQAQQVRLPLLAGGDVFYHAPCRQPLQDLLTAIRLGTTVDQLGAAQLTNAQHHLRSRERLAWLFAGCEDALRHTVEVARRCCFSLDELRYEYPLELAPDGQTPMEYLRELTWRGAARRYRKGVPDKVRELLEHELELVEQLQYEAYFLTVWDLVRFARRRNILCQGRGSAANSAVCYCLGVTSVDPYRTDVLFERFISRERNEAPDIDVDFEHERREEVLQYLYQKYGRERAGMTGVVITYRSRSAIRDAGKALGLSLDKVDALAKHVEGYGVEPKLAERCRDVGIDPDSTTGQRLVHLVNELIGFPRHLSQHVGGMVMTRGPLCELVPIENAAMPDRTVIQWDKDDLDELGILKVDCLALGMLTAIHKCFHMIRRQGGRSLTLANVPPEDPEVYEMVSRAETIGVFQIESRAQMSMLPRLQPRCFYDLVIEVAIVRPGPIQGQMVHPYLRRRAGLESVSYPNDEIRDVLHKTLGVPLFQEQAMRLAVVAAGFTPGEADQLRRAMGAWRRPGVIDHFRQKLIEGMCQKGLTEDFAQRVFQQIRGFGEYGFPESHAASFALLVYISAWLKRYYPAVFTAGLINSQPMGFYAPAQLIRDVRQQGVEVRPVDVNASHWDCTLEQAPGEPAGEVLGDAPHLRLGFRLLRGVPQAAIDRLVEYRTAHGPLTSVAMLRRAGLPQRVITQLADADALQSLQKGRRQALWDALGEPIDKHARPLFSQLEDDEPEVLLPELSPDEEVLADYRTAGLSLKNHPLAFHREKLNTLRVRSAAALDALSDRTPVKVAGLVLLRQRPSTAKGITFVTLEDETGLANLVLRQEIWDRYYKVARTSPAWIAQGRLERKDRVIHILVHRLEDLAARLGPIRPVSRDFR